MFSNSDLLLEDMRLNDVRKVERKKAYPLIFKYLSNEVDVRLCDLVKEHDDVVVNLNLNPD